jgi:Mrp family chromosome partitioning ATPase
VIIDGPPLLPVTDAALLSARADGALIVLRHGKTTRDQLSHAVERVEAVDAKVIGIVFNMAPAKKAGRGYGYGYGYTQEAGRGLSAESAKRVRGERQRGKRARQ